MVVSDSCVSSAAVSRRTDPTRTGPRPSACRREAPSLAGAAPSWAEIIAIGRIQALKTSGLKASSSPTIRIAFATEHVIGRLKPATSQTGTEGSTLQRWFAGLLALELKCLAADGLGRAGLAGVSFEKGQAAKVSQRVHSLSQRVRGQLIHVSRASSSEEHFFSEIPHGVAIVILIVPVVIIFFSDSYILLLFKCHSYIIVSYGFYLGKIGKHAKKLPDAKP